MGLKNPLRRNKKKGGYSGGISTSSPRARFGNWGGATAPPAIRYGHSDDSNNSTIATNQPSLSKYEQKISSSAYNGRQNDQFAQPLGLSSPPQPQQVEVGNNEGSSWAVWGQQGSNRGEADTFQHQPHQSTTNNRQHQVSRNSPFTDLAASRHTSNDMSRPPRSPGRNGSSSGGGYQNNEQLDPPEEVFNKHHRSNSHGSQALHQQQHRRTGSHYSSSGLSDYGSSTGQSSPGGGGLKAAMQREISRHRTDQGQGQGQQHVRNNSRTSSQGQHSRSNSRGSQGGRVGPSMPILDEGMTNQGGRNGGRSTERQGHTRSRSVGRNGKKVGALAAVGGASLGSRHFNSLRVGRRGKSQDESTLETTSDEQQQQQHLHPNSRFASAEESEIHDSGYFCDAPLVNATNERDESTMFGAEESTAFNESTITGETTTVEDTVGGEESTEVSYGKRSNKYDTKKKKAAVATKQHDEEETDFSTDVDEESYMTRDEEDESYIEEEEEVSYDGTYDSSYIDDESYVSEDDRHRRRGSGRRGSRRSRGRRRPSVDPSTSPGANDNTWASWFGFGGDEEETIHLMIVPHQTRNVQIVLLIQVLIPRLMMNDVTQSYQVRLRLLLRRRRRVQVMTRRRRPTTR